MTMIVLLLALAASVYSAVTLQGKVAELDKENLKRVDAARSELEEQKAAYAAIDPSTDEGMARQIEAENRAIEEAEEKTQQLQNENEQLRQENGELEQKIAAMESEEETASYLKVYESLHKGMEMVEGYLDGD